jgi:hypothetical protein
MKCTTALAYKRSVTPLLFKKTSLMNKHNFPLWRTLALAILALAIISDSATAQRRAGGGGGARQGGGSRQAAGQANRAGAAGQRNQQRPKPDNREIGSRKEGSGKNGNFSNNKVNIDKSRGDVNINVDNSKDIRINNNRNTSIRRNTYRPYTRPPIVYGGFHYRCFYPYYYHPYRPFYWGPIWHPWGFFIATLATTAIIVSFADADLPPGIIPQNYYVLNTGRHAAYLVGHGGPSLNQNTEINELEEAGAVDGEYYFDQGVFYLKGNGGYTSVAAPLGAIIKKLPEGFETIELDEAGSVKNYYWGGTFYEKISNGYKVVPPTSGAVVEHLAEGGEEVKMGEVTYVKLGETYYQPIKQNGKNMYEVVDIEKAN